MQQGTQTRQLPSLYIGMAIDALRHVVKADGLVRNGGTSAGLGRKRNLRKNGRNYRTGQIGLMAAKIIPGIWR